MFDSDQQLRLETLRNIWADVLLLDAEEIGNGDKFFELGGDSVKAIQLLGLAAERGIDIDLDTFYKNHTLEDFSRSTNDGRGHDDQNGSRKHIVPDGTTDSNSHAKLEGNLDAVQTRIHAMDLVEACERFGLAADAIVKAAPITPTQEVLFKLSTAGDIALSNYIYEVEGEDLESGLAQIAELLEAKIPAFRSTILEAGPNKRPIQLLLKKGSSPWIRSSDLGAYLRSTFHQKLDLGGSLIQYAIIRDDKAHEGKTLFVISINHIVFDGFSRFLMEKDILQILKSPEQYAVESERPWYGDFAIRMRALTNYDAQVSQYWSAYLNGAAYANIHPQSKASASGTQDGFIQYSQLEISNSASMQQTPLLLAAWTLALARQSGLRDILFALARHGRSDSDQDVCRMVGPLFSLTPFRLHLGSGGAGRAAKHAETAGELVQRVQDEIRKTAQWEQGAIPGVYPDTKGSPWAQTLVNLKSEMYAMPNGYRDEQGSGKITRFITRRDLYDYDMKSHWSLILLITQKQDTVEACMGYRSSLIGHEKAESLFGDFKHLAKELSSGEGNAVDALLA